jgi:bifunctional non-homologous end joining protein LigD
MSGRPASPTSCRRTSASSTSIPPKRISTSCAPRPSGSKGYHVVAPLDGKSGFDEVVAFTHAMARLLVQRDPEHLTLEFLKADRGNRIYVDVGRNTPGATFAAPYAVRPRAGTPVSAPCTWEEIERGDARPQSFTLRTMAARLAKHGDIWADTLDQGRSLAGPIRQVELMGAKLEVPVIRRFGSG